jgi:hypothetical protein
MGEKMDALMADLAAEAAHRDAPEYQLAELRSRIEAMLDDMCVTYLVSLLPHIGGPPPGDHEFGWLEGAAHMLIEAGIGSAPHDESIPLQYVGWHALQRPGVAARIMSDRDDSTLGQLASRLLETWDSDWRGDDRTVITSAEAAQLMGLANADAATRTLRRWGVPTAPRQPGQGAQNRYYRQQVEAARDGRPGRGARTDLHQGD